MRFIIPLVLLALSLAGTGQAAASSDREDTTCACRDSIDLPKLTSQFYYSQGQKGRFKLAVTYDPVACQGVNFHLKLEGGPKNKIGCLVDGDNNNADTSSFRPTGDSKEKFVFVRGGDGSDNQCGVNVEDLCTKTAIDNKTVYKIVVTSDGCVSTKEISFSFTCVPASTVSKTVSFRKRQEIALNIPPRHMRCPLGSQACRTGGSLKRGFAWKCLETDEIDHCGGCPGDHDAVDCTELPGISAVQCVSKRCMVAQCRPGYDLIDNECIKNGTSSSARRPQIVITEKVYKKRNGQVVPTRIRGSSKAGSGF